MKRLDAMYKCRLCGKEYVECSTGGEKGNQQFVMGIMYRAALKSLKRSWNRRSTNVISAVVEIMALLIFWGSN